MKSLLHRGTALLVALVAILAVCVDARAQEVDPARVKRILGDAEQIQNEVAKLRGMKFLREVEKGVQSEEELRAFIVEEFKKEASSDESAKQTKALVRLGLVPQGFDFAKEMVDLYAEQIAGFYDPDRKRLFLIARGAGGMPGADMNDKFTMAHELHHALQDQHFDLSKRMRLVSGNEDELMAYKGLVEGEATLVGFAYLFEKQMGLGRVPPIGPLMRMNKQMSEMMPGAQKLKAMPDYIKEGLQFPYTEGAIFVQKLYDKYGWDKITEMFADPPRSSEQILHPEKYFPQREEPVGVRLPEIETIVGGAEELWENTLGEYNIGLLLRQAHADNKAAKIAAGWAGDRFRCVQARESGNVVLAWMTVWDSAAEADEFAEGYRAVLAKKYGSTRAVTEGLLAAGKQGDVALVERNGSASVLIVEGAADEAQAERLRQTAWGSVIVHTREESLGKIAARSLTGEATPSVPPVVRVEKKPEPKTTASKKAPLFADEATGFSFGLPSDGYEKTDEPIGDLAPYTKVRFANEKSGASIRLIDVPIPFDKAGLRAEIENYSSQVIPDFKKLGDKDITVAGRDAFEIEFEGSMPGSEGTTTSRAVAIDNDGWTLLLLMTAPKGSYAAAKKDFDTVVWTARFAGAKGKPGATPGAPFAVPEGFEKQEAPSPLVKASYLDKDGAGIQIIKLPIPVEDLEQAVNLTESRLPDLIPGYKKISGGRVKLGDHAAYELVFEGERPEAEGLHRFRQIVMLVDGNLQIVNCFSPSGVWSKKARAFEQVLDSMGGVKGGGAPAPKAEPKGKRPVY